MIKRLLQALLVLALATSFISLGVWQLHRAQDMKNHKEIADTKVYPMTDIAAAEGSIAPSAIGKTVSTSGHYIANFKAPNQIDGKGKVADWEVALLQNDTNTAILVVRGLWKIDSLAPIS